MLKLLLIPLMYLLYKMFSFPIEVENKLTGLGGPFSIRVRCWLLLVKLFLGYDVLIVSGLRSFAEQLRQHQADSRNPAPSQEKPDSHMLGRAVDVNFWQNGTPVLLKKSSPAEWSAVVQLAQLCGLRWGGNFTGYADNNHFDDY